MKKLLCAAFCLSLAFSVRAQTTVWKVTSADQPFYLAGSIHVLKASDYPLPAEFEKAYGEAVQVYFETDLAKFSEPAMQLKLMQKAMYQDGRTLQDALKAETYAMLGKYCKEKGLPLAQFQLFKPWMVTVMMMMAELQKLGVDPMHGVDYYYSQKAAKDQKATGGLETPEEHLNAITSLDEALNDDMVQSAIKEAGEITKVIKDLLGAWRRGDVVQIDKYVSGDLREEHPKLYKTLIVDRNQAWTPKVDELIKSGKPGLVIVGVGHLVGKDSVIKMLEAKGHKVERYQAK